MCFNRKVIAGLVVAALGTYLIAPNLLASALPLLLLAACPLSMLLMGRAMMGRQGTAPAVSGSRLDPPIPSPAEAGLDRDERVTQLHAQLQSLGQQQAELTRQLARIEPSPITGPAGAAVPKGGAAASAATTGS